MEESFENTIEDNLFGVTLETSSGVIICTTVREIDVVVSDT